MFKEIEKQYKQGLQQRRFASYYWPGASLVVALAIVVTLFFGSVRWIVYGCAVVAFLVIVVVFFIWEIHHAGKTFRSVRESRGLLAKFAAYFVEDDQRRIDSLVVNLAQNDIKTKDDLKITLDYFQSRLPDVTKPSALSWILTAAITLSSIVVVAYDDSIGMINLHRLFSVFGSAFVVALIILTPIIIAQVISISMSLSRNKVDATLVEDLAYIYVHFEKYRAQLEKGG